MKFEIHKTEDGETVGCACCDSEVPTRYFERWGEPKYPLCAFCASSFGKRGDTVTKEILAQMLNVLRWEKK